MLKTLILAAGKGTRMNSDLPKVLHKVNSLSMLQHVINRAKDINSSEIIIIVGYKKELIMQQFNDPLITFIEQNEQLGTGHAVLQAMKYLHGYKGNLLVLSGDVPMITSKTLHSLITNHTNNLITKATILTNIVDDPTGMGRIIRDDEGQFVKITEEKDIINLSIRNIKEVNTGIYIFDSKQLFKFLPYISNCNNQKEYYLPDVLPLLSDVNCFQSDNNVETMGINTLEELRKANRIMYFISSNI